MDTPSARRSSHHDPGHHDAGHVGLGPDPERGRLGPPSGPDPQPDTRPESVDAEHYDCQACGACCHGDEGWVHVDAADDIRVETSPLLASLVVLTRSGGYVKRSLRMVRQVCAALETLSSGKVSCRVYEDRPAVCRELDAGTPHCLSARARLGMSHSVRLAADGFGSSA